MEDRRQEIQNLVPNMIAALMPVIDYYRQRNGNSDFSDLLKHYGIRVEDIRVRFQTKVQNLRNDPACAKFSDLLDSASKEIDTVASVELMRAKADKKVEFKRD